VFAFFGVHTLLWGVREAVDAVRERHTRRHRRGGRPIERFARFHRVVHAFVIVSFLGLAATGAPLKFAHTAWAQGIFAVIGGVSAAGWWHRLFAIITFGYFSAHVFYMARKLWRHSRSGTLRKALLGPDSLVPRLSDARDIVAHVRWFVGAGPRPTWDRWTYWEKFDYWAVFWGVAIIGASGLMLWFPAFFSSFLPGWIINIALIIHSDEALLAIGFIFGVHFFNSHLRRNKSPWTRSSSPAPFRRRSTARSADANGPAWRPRAGSRSAGESRPARPSSGGCTSSASWPG
jgi:cytochrome b subunit of formate dehydrogenase